MRTIFSNKNIVLGVTGSIAAYKACEIASKLAGFGSRVTPVLTKSAQELVGASTFEALTGSPVITDMFAPLQNMEIEHISLATSADLFIIAPATANILAKAACGIADDWLSTTLLATHAPILFAPAMNSNMYAHPATCANIETLRSRGCHFVGPDTGRLACGSEGPGRMVSAETVIEAALPLLADENSPLYGKHILMTSGSNHEPIDPVRFIGNRSSGKMGRSIAVHALACGAHVAVIKGPSEVSLPWGCEVIDVETGSEMHSEVMARISDADVYIGTAAVADYCVAEPMTEKSKRDGSGLSVELKENPDIISEVAASKKSGQVIAGFAAETQNVIENAKCKLENKKLDIVVANEVGTEESGFGTDNLRAALITRDTKTSELTELSKDEVAVQLLTEIEKLL